MKFERPIPIDREIVLDPKKTIMSKTDAKGVIEFANDYFMEICGYEEFELMGKPHNVIRHPDMPRVIFKILWDRLHQGKNIHAVVKNLAKDGSYYWVITNFETKYDGDKIISHYSHRKAAPKYVVEKIEKLYKILLTLEEGDRSLNKALKYFIGYFEELNVSYDDFILNLIGTDEKGMLQYFNPNQAIINASNAEKIESENTDTDSFIKEEENTSQKDIQSEKLKEIEDEIKKIESLLLSQQEAKANTKKSNFFKRFFLGE